MMTQNAASSITFERFTMGRHVADLMDAAHTHDHVELNLLATGEMTYLFNGRQEHVEAGRVALFWAALPHRTVTVRQDSMLICAYLPLADVLALPVQRERKRDIVQGGFLIASDADPLDIALGNRWVANWAAGNSALRRVVEEEVKLRVTRLLMAPRNEGTSDAAGGERRAHLQHVERLIALINAQYAEPIGVAHLARLAGIHPSTASLAFRSVVGTSINEYLTRYRLGQAMNRLTETTDPILDVAFSSGFGSTSRFYDVFKHLTGRTPRQFRNQSVASLR